MVDDVSKLAVHDTEIKRLQKDMDKLVGDMEEVKEALREISHTLSAAKGGWHMLMVVGGVGASIGAVLAWALDTFKH